MKKTLLLGFVITASGVLWAADAVQPLDVKLGQWETTITTDMAGRPPIPPDVLERLTPEQRAKMEERIKGYASNAPRTISHKSCLKKEDLDKAMSFGAEQKSCTRTILTSNRSKQEIHMECAIGGGKQSGTVRVEAVSSENVKGTSQMSMTMGERTMNVNTSFNSKWIGSACTEKE